MADLITHRVHLSDISLLLLSYLGKLISIISIIQELTSALVMLTSFFLLVEIGIQDMKIEQEYSIFQK